MSCPVSVYCGGVGCHAMCLYTVTGCGVMSCVCGMTFQCGTSRHRRDMTSDVKVTFNTNKQTDAVRAAVIMPQQNDINETIWIAITFRELLCGAPGT